MGAQHALTDPEEVERICNEYLAECREEREKNTITVKNGERRVYAHWPSIEALALRLHVHPATLKRYLAEARRDEEGARGDYRGDGDSLSNFLSQDSNATQDGHNADTVAQETGKTLEDVERKEKECREYKAHKAICDTLARVRTEIICDIIYGADTGLMEPRAAQARLASFGIGKDEADNSRRVVLEGYTADDLKDLMT